LRSCLRFLGTLTSLWHTVKSTRPCYAVRLLVRFPFRSCACLLQCLWILPMAFWLFRESALRSLCLPSCFITHFVPYTSPRSSLICSLVRSPWIPLCIPSSIGPWWSRQEFPWAVLGAFPHVCVCSFPYTIFGLCCLFVTCFFPFLIGSSSLGSSVHCPLLVFERFLAVIFFCSFVFPWYLLSFRHDVWFCCPLYFIVILWLFSLICVMRFLVF